MSKTRILGIVLAIGLIVGSASVQWGGPVAEYAGQAWSAIYGGKPSQAIVVRESGDPKSLTQSQVAWINDPKLRASCKTAGIQFLVADPGDIDRDGKTPQETKAAIDRAIAKGLPRLILVGPRGGITDFVLPADDAAIRLRLGVQ